MCWLYRIYRGDTGVYVASFNHVDNLGYLAIISINGVFQDSISNICAYPDVFIDAQDLLPIALVGPVFC